MKKIDSKTLIVFVVIIIFAAMAFGVILYQGLSPFLTFKGLSFATVGDFFKRGGAARILDGVYLKEGETEKYPVAIVIDNKYEARPWSGLSFAGVVFEAPVEGGITRFLAIYSGEKNIEKIGPVRSVRPYFIDWAAGYGAIFAHVGGSPEALGIIYGNANIAKLNLDQSREDSYFWRSQDRYAPHNVYTSTEKMNAARNKKLAKQDLVFSSWQFKDDEYDSERGDTKEIKINFSIYEIYNAAWEYDKEKNIYFRKVSGKAVSDAEGSLILAKNIAIMETDIVIIDEVSRRCITTVGGGNAVIFQDGKKIEGTWEKKDRNVMLKFFDKDGNEIKFNRGTTWVEVVDGLDKVTEK